MSESLADEIRTLALRFGLPSRYTSYLVVEPGPVADLPMSLDAVTQNFRSLGGNASAAAPARATTGAGAVRAASTARQMRSLSSAEELQKVEAELMSDMLGDDTSLGERRALGGRIFELREDVWTDLERVEGQATLSVQRFSAAWFALVEALPEIAPVLQNNDNVVIGGEELTLEVGPAGVEELTDAEVLEAVEGFRGPSGG